MNGHTSKEINGFLKKMDFKVTFILINETFNLKAVDHPANFGGVQ